MLRNCVTTEYHHVEALKKAGGEPLTTSYWFPDAAFAVRFAQGELGNKEIGAPNDEGFENFDWPTLAEVRHSLEELGFGYGTESSQPGKFYEYPGDPLASGVGTPVNHPHPA